MKIVEKLKKVAEDAKKPAGKDNNKKGGPRKVTTPKGKTKMACRYLVMIKNQCIVNIVILILIIRIKEMM